MPKEVLKQTTLVDDIVAIKKLADDIDAKLILPAPFGRCPHCEEPLSYEESSPAGPDQPEWVGGYYCDDCQRYIDE